MTQLWISLKALPHWTRHGIWLVWSLWQVIMLSVNEIMTLWHRQMSLIMEVWNHLHLQLCEVWSKSYSFLDSNIFIYDVYSDCLWCILWLFLTLIMIIFVVISIYVMYISLLILQGLIFQRENKKSKVDKIWKGLRSLDFWCFFEKNLSDNDS